MTLRDLGPVLALGVSQIIGYGTLYYAFPLLVPSVAATFGQSESLLFGIFSIGILCGGLTAPRLGRLFDRIGAPRVMTWGSLAAAATLVLVATAPHFLVWAGLLLLLQTIAVSVLYDAAFAALVRHHGPAGRVAITRLTLIAGFASTLFWPLTDALIGWLGWRGALLVFAALHATLGFGIHLWLSRLTPIASEPADPASPAQHGSDARALPSWAFGAVAASFAMTGMLVSAIGVHMVLVLAGLGLGASATLVAMLMGPAQVAIRLINALFWNAFHPLSVAAIAVLALPVAICCLLVGLPVWLAAPLFAGLFGIGQGLNSIIRGSVPLALFGAEGFGARLGRLALITAIAAAGAPFAFAALRSGLGLFPTLTLFLVIGVVAALPILILRARLIRQ